MPWQVTVNEVSILAKLTTSSQELDKLVVSFLMVNSHLPPSRLAGCSQRGLMPCLKK